MTDDEQYKLSKELLIDQIGELHAYQNSMDFENLVKLMCDIYNNLYLYQKGHFQRLKDQNLQNQIQ